MIACGSSISDRGSWPSIGFALRGRPARDVEQQRPVDPAVADRAEADQVGKDRVERPAGLEPVELPNLRMTVAIGGVRELERDEGDAVRPVEARPACPELVDELRSNETRQELVHDQPLVVPAERAACLVEEFRLGDAVLAQPVDEQVVRADERNLHLAHEGVHVVARITDEGDALMVPRQVAVVLEQLRRVVAAVEVRRASRAVAVERLEVRARGARVAQCLEVGVRTQRRSVGGEVMRDVLAEERPTRFDVSRAFAVAAVAETAGRTQLVQQRLVRVQRRQIEHPPVTPARPGRHTDALRRKTVVAGDL